MKRTRALQRKEEEEGGDVTIHTLTEDVRVYILLLIYELIMEDLDEVIEEPLFLLNRIVFKATLILPTMSTTQFLALYLPQIQYIPTFMMAQCRTDALSLFRGVRKLTLHHFHEDTTKDGCFKDLTRIETLILSGSVFNLTQANEWKNLRSLTVGHNCHFVVVTAGDASSIYGRLKELTLFRYSPEEYSVPTGPFLEDLTTQCTNLNTLSLDNYPKLINGIYEHLPLLTKLSVLGTTKFLDRHLHHLTSLYELNLNKYSAITSEGLQQSVAQTLRVLEMTNSFKGMKSLTMLVNLGFLHISRNTHISGTHFSKLTNLSYLSIDATPERKTLRRLCLPVSLQSLTLGKETSYVVSDATLYNLTNLVELGIKSDVDLTPHAFMRLTHLTDLRIAFSSVLTDSVVPYLTNLTCLSVRTRALKGSMQVYKKAVDLNYFKRNGTLHRDLNNK